MKSYVIAGALLIAGSVHAQQNFWDDVLAENLSVVVGYFTAEDLFRGGRGSVMNGYVAAVYDSDRMGTLGRNYCVPDGVKLGQLSDVAWNYLEQNPERRHLSAAHLVRQSFVHAWPCSPR